MDRRSDRGIMLQLLTALMMAITVVVSAGLVLSAMSSMVSPTQCKYAIVMWMTFPVWFIAAVAVLIVDLIWWRRTAIVAGLSMLAVMPWINDFCPMHLHLGGMSNQQRSRSFTVMTYNVMCFRDQDGRNAGEPNRQIDYLLDANPDIACLQEAEYIQPTTHNGVTQEQIAEIQKRYPYMFASNEFVFLSKYPAVPIDFTFPKSEFHSGDIAGWRVTIDDRIVNIFGVHLRSMAYNKEQLGIFRDKDIKGTRSELMPILLKAAKERVEQERYLESYLRKFGGENVILLGDINDTECCYTIYRLEHECNLRQAYSEAGFGPMITYNSNNFYFRLDHILYRGAMTPWKVGHGNISASDHYPVMATFLLDDNG